jgi:hypothetical protein
MGSLSIRGVEANAARLQIVPDVTSTRKLDVQIDQLDPSHWHGCAMLPRAVNRQFGVASVNTSQSRDILVKQPAASSAASCD